MILTAEVKIKSIKNLSSEYIEMQLRNMSFDVLRWAIVSYDDDFYILSISYSKD